MAETFGPLFKPDGIVWLLDGVEYANNIGGAIRTAECTGSCGVVISTQRSHSKARSVRHFSMKTADLLPVRWASTSATISAAREAGYSIVAVEDCGMSLPWEVNLAQNVLIAVGSEKSGVSKEVLEAADSVVRIPMLGRHPCLNVTSALSMIALESVRQRITAPALPPVE